MEAGASKMWGPKPEIGTQQKYKIFNAGLLNPNFS